MIARVLTGAFLGGLAIVGLVFLVSFWIAAQQVEPYVMTSPKWVFLTGFLGGGLVARLTA